MIKSSFLDELSLKMWLYNSDSYLSFWVSFSFFLDFTPCFLLTLSPWHGRCVCLLVPGWCPAWQGMAPRAAGRPFRLSLPFIHCWRWKCPLRVTELCPSQWLLCRESDRGEMIKKMRTAEFALVYCIMFNNEGIFSCQKLTFILRSNVCPLEFFFWAFYLYEGLFFSNYIKMGNMLPAYVKYFWINYWRCILSWIVMVVIGKI